MSRDAMVRLAFGGMAPRTVDRLLDAHGSPQGALHHILRAPGKLAPLVPAFEVTAATRFRQLEESGIRFLLDGDSGWPAKLKRFPGSPHWLFVKGDVQRAPSIGIVGTRTCTAYGTELADEYGHAASRLGWTVVSGLAKGIDHAAHSGAVRGGSECCAVLGSGIDVVYPRRHAPLHDAILDAGGAIVSEFPPGTRPDGWRFPTRNRIIVGLSDILLVVEAGRTGGALITARIALDWGVPVFAVPGDVDREASVGTNHLIRDGAFPVFGANDLEEVLSLVTPFAA